MTENKEGFKPDVLVIIEQHFSSDALDAKATETVIRTNVRKEYLGEILLNWVQDMSMTGRCGGTPEAKSVYTIEIGYKVSTDSYAYNYDTGHKGLAVGIVMNIAARVDEGNFDRITLKGLPDSSYAPSICKECSAILGDKEEIFCGKCYQWAKEGML